MDSGPLSEPLLRLIVFLAVLVAMGVWEMRVPRRPVTITRAQRWPSNFGLLAVDVIVLRIVFPGAAVGFALFVETRGWGFSSLLTLPPWLVFAGAVLVLDFVIYLQHVLFHAVPALWRLHRVHHTDLAVDVTTGLRFHPLEILLSMAIKLGAIAAIGAPAGAVLLFEVLLNATSMFNHGNVYIPPAIDCWIRCFVVTPDMHRVHHSIIRNETNSNFAFNFPWWDRCFGTYRAQPHAGHGEMTIGIEQFREERDARLGRLLLQPVLDRPSIYPVNRGPEN